MAFVIAVTDPAVQASIVAALGSIAAAAIAAIAAAAIGKQLSGKKKLQTALSEAVTDIEFLLVVEQEHCALHKEVSEESFKQRVRQAARDRGHEWSGRFTPGRVRAMSMIKD